MHPSERIHQETDHSHEYGMYTGTEQPSSTDTSQQYEQANKNHSGDWNRAEGISGQQQMYTQPVFSYSTYTPVLPEEHLPAALSYSLGWFSGVIVLFFGWKSRFIRFHALQSLLFFGAVNIFDIVSLRFFATGWHHFHGPIGFLLTFCLLLLVNTIAVLTWIVGMVQAGSGKYYQLPFIGSAIMRKFVAPSPVK